MGYDRVAAVTGANKGIGFAIVRQLALQYPKSSLNTGSFLIYLTARDESRGEQALTELRGDSQLKAAKSLKHDGGPTEVRYHPLDVSRTNSIRNFADYLKKEHPEGVDIVVNNAGIAGQGFDAEVVKTTLQCNYYGTLEATLELLPLIKDGGRLINVASVVGHLSPSKYSKELVEQFVSGAESGDHNKISAMMKNFYETVAAGKHTEKGWPSSAYAVSKAGCIGMTMAIANAKKKEGGKHEVLINACCPGYVNTDMTKGRGVKTPDQGAQTPVMLALGDIGGRSGEFWQNEKVSEW